MVTLFKTKNSEKKLPDNNRFQELVIENLGDLKKTVGSQGQKIENLQAQLYKEFTQIRIDLSEQKIKSGLVGMIAGAIPVAIMIAISFFTNKH